MNLPKRLVAVADHPTNDSIMYIRDARKSGEFANNEIAVSYCTESKGRGAVVSAMVERYNALAGLDSAALPDVVSSLSYLEQQLDSGQPVDGTDLFQLQFTAEFRTAFKASVARLKQTQP